MIGIGLIGAGRIGRLHARTIAASGRARLAALCDPDGEAAAALAAETGAQVAPDAETLIARPDVAAVFICSPTDTHVDYSRLAARAGRAVFCEKPIAPDLAAARAVLPLLAAHPVPFMTGFHRRFDPGTRRLGALARGGAVGPLEFLRVVSRDPAPPPIGYIRRSGGIFRDMSIHDLDLCRWLTGEEFDHVFARGFCVIDPAIGAAGDADTATLTLWNARGLHVTIQNSRRSGGGFDQRIEVMGARGRLALENLPLTTVLRTDADGTRSDPLPDHFPERYAAAYPAQLEAFLDAVDGRCAPATTARDGLAALALAEACAASAALGAPVAVAPLPEAA